MDTKYILTPSGNFVSTDELYHWGIKGMKWGVRRYQNADGTLTAEGKKRYLNPDGTLNKKGKKKFGDSVKLDETPKPRAKTSDEYLNEQIANMTDQELMQKVIRLRQEDSFRELSKKLGYDGPKSDIDYQIAELTKQKTYLALQKDVKDLNNQLHPKKENAVKKLMESVMNKVVAPAATEVSKNLLKQYLGEAGSKILGNEAKKTKDNIDKNVKKEQAKQEAQKEKQSAESAAKANVYDDSVSGERKKSKKTKSGGGGSSNSSSNTRTERVVAEVVDNYSSRPASSTSSNSYYNSSWTSRYNSTPVYSLPSPNIYGYLPAPKDDD